MYAPKAQTSKVDPWSAMPDWATKYYKGIIGDANSRSNRADRLRDRYASGKDLIAEYQGQKGVDMVKDAAAKGGKAADAAREQAGGLIRATTGAVGDASRFGDRATDILKGSGDRASQAYKGIAGGIRDSTRDAVRGVKQGQRGIEDATGLLGDAAGRLEDMDFDLGEAYDTRRHRDALTKMDIEGIQGRYEDDYTDEVLDPTMSRMREDEARALAQSEGRSAAIGGSGNTRMAVEMARIGDEASRSRAQTEAEIRQTNLRQAQELGLSEAQMRGDFQSMAAQMGMSQADQEATIAQMQAELGLSREEAMRQMASTMAQTSDQGARLGLAGDASRRDALGDLSDIIGRRYDMRSDVADSRRQQAELALAGGGLNLDAARTALSRGQLGLEAGRQGMAAGEYTASEAERRRSIRQERMQAPLTMEEWLRDMQSTPLPMSLPGATTTTSTGGGAGLGTQLLGAGTSLLGGYLAGGAAAGGGLMSALSGLFAFSDENVKEEIRPIEGALDIMRRQRPSTYQYTEPAYDRVPIEGRRSAGLMAQDLEEIPGAVIMNSDGIRMVDPYPVMATIAAAVQELDRKVEGMKNG